MKTATRYYYSTNGDGTTYEGFRPFANGDRAEAPDWNPDATIECGQGLHVVTDNPLKALRYVSRDDPIFYEVKPEKLLPENGGKHRCKALTRIREVEITDAWLAEALADPEWYACVMASSVTLCERCLAAGADVHAEDDLALRRAAGGGYVEMVKILLAAGADVHADRDSALRSAAAAGHVEVVKAVLAAGADVRARNDYALCSAAEGGHVEVVKAVLAAGADVHAVDDYMLRRATEGGHIEMVEILEEAMNK